MSTEAVEQMQQEIESQRPPELFEVPALPADFASDETAVLTSPPPVGECDVFVESSLIAPVSLWTRPFVDNWNLVKGKRARDIEDELRAEGWHFFYVVPDFRSTAMARRPENAIRKALAKVLQRAFERGLNTVEIVSLQTRRVLGIHRAELIARPRHIQKSPYLFSTNEEMHQRMLREIPRLGLFR